MVTPQHEALHRIFTHDEELFARTMSRVFGQEVPVPEQVEILNTDFTEVSPHVRRGDSVLLAHLVMEDPSQRYVLIVEAQTEKDEEEAPYRWPYYVAYLHDKYKCPVVLLIVCSKRTTARWARKPIRIGLPGLTCMTVRGVVLGPDNVPAVTSPEEAGKDVGFAVFAALTHSRSRQIGGILETLAEALGTVDEETGSLLAQFTEAGLGETKARTTWRGLMKTANWPYVAEMRAEGREEGRQEGRQEGLQQGRAEAIIEVLDDRGITMKKSDRERVLSCTDTETLRNWLRAALTVSRISDLFANQPA